MKLKRLMPLEFNRVVQSTGLTEQTRAMAREVLVDGAAQATVAAKYGMTRQRVHLAINAVEKAYFNGFSAGSSVVSVTVDLPEGLAVEVAEFAAALENLESPEARDAVLAQVIKTMAELHDIA